MATLLRPGINVILLAESRLENLDCCIMIIYQIILYTDSTSVFSCLSGRALEHVYNNGTSKFISLSVFCFPWAYARLKPQISINCFGYVIWERGAIHIDSDLSQAVPLLDCYIYIIQLEVTGINRTIRNTSTPKRNESSSLIDILVF